MQSTGVPSTAQTRGLMCWTRSGWRSVTAREQALFSLSGATM